MANEIGACVISLEGKELAPEESEILAHPLIGGVILFARNYDSKDQLKALCRSIRQTRSHPILIMVDQEGGRVQRFINEFTRLPAMGSLGALYNENPDQALQLANHCGWLMASELLSVGIDLSLAPVLDLDKGRNTVIGSRAFHANALDVVRLATAFARGMQEAGMASVGKHFPGHGAVALDSHLALPVDERSFNEIEQDDLIPFAALIKAGIAGMMAAHIIFPQVDATPVGFSRVWLQTILRQQLKFKGVILSDDLNMEGANISANYADRVAMTREAGCDFALVCNNRKAAIQVLDNLPATAHTVAEPTWGRLRGDFSRLSDSYQKSTKYQETHEFLLKLTQVTG